MLIAIPPIEQKLKREKEFKRKKKEHHQILESLRKFKILNNYISIHLWSARKSIGWFPREFLYSLIIQSFTHRWTKYVS